MLANLATAGVFVLVGLSAFVIGSTINAALPRILSALRGEGGWE